MAKIIYQIVEHDGGWAYRSGGVFSHPFPRHATAVSSAQQALAEQELPDPTKTIEYEDDKGIWHVEVDPGDDRPDTEVVDEEE